LLGHLGGIRHYRSDTPDDPEVSSTKHFADPIAGGISLFANDPLIAKPGTKFIYSTHGFTLVGCAIEGASGEKYADYIRQHILIPAAMADTRPDDRYAVIAHRASFYSKSKTGAVINADFIDSSYKLPGGGWLSSADDMARFEVAILGDHLLKPATRSVMWTAQHAEAAPPQEGKRAYALGWGEGEIAGMADVGHDGGEPGTSTCILLVPLQRTGVVVLVNMDGVDVSALAADLITTLLKGNAAR
jgi:serine beta-lactamase-like protein LACTB, mitochondrial